MSKPLFSLGRKLADAFAGVTPACPKCGQVIHAEQVNAANRSR